MKYNVSKLDTKEEVMSLFDFVTIDFETANSRMSSACSEGYIL